MTNEYTKSLTTECKFCGKLVVMKMRYNVFAHSGWMPYNLDGTEHRCLAGRDREA